MNEEEAREELKKLDDWIDSTPSLLEDWIKTSNALEMASQALKLQHPKLVIYESDGDFDGVPVYDMAYCPNCDTLIMDDEANWEEPYCMKCGQALKWEVDAEC